MINFASDNVAAVHPDVLKRLSVIDSGGVKAYGEDLYTKEAADKLRELVDIDCEVFFMVNGTGANVTALNSITESFDLILTAPASHITEDECGAIFKSAGCAVSFVSDNPKKINAKDIEPFMSRKGVVHKSQPRVVSISQATEMGEVYSLDELKSIYMYTREQELSIHIDGARVCNSCVSINRENPSEIMKKIMSYCDLLCFGGTKNGLMCAEAVLVKDRNIARKFNFLRKQNMQLISKMRYISSQFTALLENNLWVELAIQANDMAKIVRNAFRNSTDAKVINNVDANIIFVKLNNEAIKKLSEKYYFYTIEKGTESSLIRLMTSWQTTVEEAEMFAYDIKKVCS